MLQEKVCWVVISLVFLVSCGYTSPILTFTNVERTFNPFIPKDFCTLPPELGYEGKVKFIEECHSLDRYETVPLPASDYVKFGTHPSVCCPKMLPNSSICFETDAWCPTYTAPEPIDYPQESAQLQYSDDDYIPIQIEKVITILEAPKMADQVCGQDGVFFNISGFGELSECVPLTQCGTILDNDSAPQNQTKICGFDEEEQVLMICCPEDHVTKSESLKQKARYPARNGKARKVEDAADQCRKWRNNEGCSLDKDLVISELDPWNGRVTSISLFGFMQAACLRTCGWASKQECVDEHPLCPTWARIGTCIMNPFFMAHTCRESCGVCGFLSPANKEEQVVGGKSYTDFTRENFDCGRYKPLCEINNTPCNETDSAEETTKAPIVETDIDLFDLREDNSDDVFFSSDAPENGEFFCGATMVTDRWVVAASHCYDDFGGSANTNARQVKINTIRDNTDHFEVIEIKRVYKHPLYKYPNLYDDIAVLELGRRVEYNYELFGDTPSCIDQGQDNLGKTATVQGYGLTEDGTKGDLLETNVTIISNEMCKNILDSNTTDTERRSHKNTRKKIELALPKGLNYGMFCAQGEMNEEGIFKGSCKGDSGGPLTTPNENGRSTLVGIVSGGIGCGKGYPGWFTRVSFHINWVKCIINNSIRYNNDMEKVDKECKKIVKKAPKCVPFDDLIFGDLRSLDSEEEACTSETTEVDNELDADLRQF